MFAKNMAMKKKSKDARHKLKNDITHQKKKKKACLFTETWKETT